MSLKGTDIVGRTFFTNTGNAGGHIYKIQFGYKFEYHWVFSPPKSDIGVGDLCVDIFSNA
jgi:hypothetical protein